MESGIFCVLPWLTMALSANLGGWIADKLVSKGVSITTVCKIILMYPVQAETKQR
jgi:ACS family sodium-dependent inorganic phosphate cotransporter